MHQDHSKICGGEIFGCPCNRVSTLPGDRNEPCSGNRKLQEEVKRATGSSNCVFDENSENVEKENGLVALAYKIGSRGEMVNKANFINNQNANNLDLNTASSNNNIRIKLDNKQKTSDENKIDLEAFSRVSLIIVFCKTIS